MLSDKYKTAAEFLGPATATNLARLLGPGGTKLSRAADSLARMAGPYMQGLVGNESLRAAQSLGQFNQSGYKNKPANIGTGYNKRTARLLAQAKKQGQANNPRITAPELQGIIAKVGGGDAFLQQTSAMAGLKRDLGPAARKQFDALRTDYANRNRRRRGDDTPEEPVGTTPTVPGQPRSPIPSATEGTNGSPGEFLSNFISVSPVFRNIGNPDVRVGGMSVGNIRMRR